ncbi:MAG: recombination protein O N-terminal domain-containing protein, partial [Patescibacteria group bacterium]
MTHVKYHTEGIVLKNSPSGESSSHVWLLTKDFGFIAGHAQSIRELASKLRYSLQDFSHAHVDVVYGRNGWKITSAVFIRNFARASHDGALPAGITAISNIRSLLMRLCRGEEKDDVLFDDVCRGFSLLSSSSLSSAETERIEIILVMRILSRLGYWGDDAILSPFLSGDIGAPLHAAGFREHKLRAVGAINKA